MAGADHNDRADDRYLELVRQLVLAAASDLNCTIFLYGSRARGTHRRSSDIDIGFSGLSDPEFNRLRDRLVAELEESVVPHHIDLVHMDKASDHFREAATEKVIIWKQKSGES